MQNAIIISRCSSNDQRQDVYRQQQELLSTYGTQYNIVKGFTYYKSGTKNYEVNTEILEFAIKNNVNQLLDQSQNLGRNVKIKLEICNLRIYHDPNRAFKIYAS